MVIAMRKTLATVVLVVIVVGVLAMNAVATRDDGNPPSEGYARVTGADAAAADALAVLREQRDAADDLPAAIADRMYEKAPFGMNPHLSRRSIGNLTNSVYVIPADGHVCMSLTVGDGANLVCPSTDEVVAGRAAGATVGIDTGDVAVYGLVPDGVESVTVRADGSSSQVGVENNTYYVVVPTRTELESVVYTGPSGSVESPLDNPKLVFEGSR